VNWKEGTLRNRLCLSKMIQQMILTSKKKRVETLNEKLMSGTPFAKQQIKIKRITKEEVPYLAPTPEIEPVHTTTSSSTLIKKATIEEVPDKEGGLYTPPPLFLKNSFRNSDSPTRNFLPASIHSNGPS
jgi:hypothetical protein